MNKNKFKMEYLIYLFLLLTPFFDALSFLFRQYVPDAIVSPSTILRPMIPCFLLGYIFIKDVRSRKWLSIGAIIYVLYGIFHLMTFQHLHTGFQAGSVISEFQYVINYSYMIGLFYAFYWFYQKTGLPYLQKMMAWTLVIYLGLIYLAIITGTSSSTYIDGIGYKGWNASGNGLSAVFILGFWLTFTYFMKHIKKIWVWILFGALFYYLLILFGTRTAFFGSLLVVVVYGVSRMFIYVVRQKKLHVKQFVMLSIVLVLLASAGMVGGANVLKRRQNMQAVGETIKDPMTGEVAHLTGDLSNFVMQIKDHNLSVEMSEAQKQALLKTYDEAVKREIANSDRRTQQLLYHHYLFQEQFSFSTVLFGHGYLNQYPELTLEMEVPAFFYNFGILGFLLYFGPFLGVFLMKLFKFFKHIKNTTIDEMMLLSGSGLSFVLSLLTGYVYFYVPSMLVVIVLFVLLIGESKKVDS